VRPERNSGKGATADSTTWSMIAEGGFTEMHGSCDQEKAEDVFHEPM
jgi:IMP dehydrogenase/GMP reductase